MAKTSVITYAKENQANVQLTIDMLEAMLTGIKECDLEIYERTLIAKSEEDSDNVTESDIEGDIVRFNQFINALTPYIKFRGVAKQIKSYQGQVAYLKNRLSGMRNYVIPEHRAIMLPVQTNLEGIFATREHLGEGKPAVIYKVGNAKHMTGGAGLNNLEKIIYYEAGMTAQGDAVLPHEDRSKRPWFKYAGGVKAKFGCTTLQAEELYTAFKILDTTPSMAKIFAKWIEKRGIEKAVTYFRSLAIPLMCVTDTNEPTIIDTAESYIEDHETDADHPAEIADIKADAWHKLDDPRDNVPTWESRQPAEFKFILEIIRTASLSELKTIGVAFFKEKSHLEKFNKTQTTVIWDEYKRAKHRKSPKLRPLALKALERLADKTANLAAAANWLHGQGKAALNQFELSVVWDAWKKCRKAYAPKQTAMNIPDPIEIPYDELDLYYNMYGSDN